MQTSAPSESSMTPGRVTEIAEATLGAARAYFCELDQNKCASRAERDEVWAEYDEIAKDFEELAAFARAAAEAASR